jgi:hypothetical protein
MVKHILLIITALALSSCNRFEIKGLFVPTGDSVQKRFEQSMEMNDSLKSCSLDCEEEYSFYVATDPHIDKTYKNLGIFNDTFRNDTDALFAVILGDCIEVKGNLPRYLEALSYHPDRHSHDNEIFHLLGNHEIYFNGWNDFRELVGPSVYWFEVIFNQGKDLYISLDTASGTLGARQTEWLRSFLEGNRKDYRYCIILTHTNFFYTDNSQMGSGNMPIEESFALIDLLGKQHVDLVLQGHDHYREDLTYANVRYTVVGTIQDGSDAPEYLKVNVNKDGLHLNWMLTCHVPTCQAYRLQ